MCVTVSVYKTDSDNLLLLITGLVSKIIKNKPEGRRKNAVHQCKGQLNSSGSKPSAFCIDAQPLFANYKLSSILQFVCGNKIANLWLCIANHRKHFVIFSLREHYAFSQNISLTAFHQL